MRLVLATAFINSIFLLFGDSPSTEEVERGSAGGDVWRRFLGFTLTGSGASELPISHILNPRRFGSLISAANFPHGRRRTPRNLLQSSATAAACPESSTTDNCEFSSIISPQLSPKLELKLLVGSANSPDKVKLVVESANSLNRVKSVNSSDKLWSANSPYKVKLVNLSDGVESVNSTDKLGSTDSSYKVKLVNLPDEVGSANS
nr:hypothetical protein Iba_scaffold39273CG0020 [Ipomoea batatas]GMD29788.1 hypothetical protein Iba_chr09aCG0920 [Ipomoea batatas]GMD31689.1 hypothetical protein Iba_chr09bCG1260 [Ipomoea batatas]GME02392.1 hypothetical protein Iba_contig4758CG0010 [Ipomoea batatas]GME12125.1 hypothetical protein Iba_scaffold13375CG0030 [Ipomoea batatas]